ncbi:MAG: RNA helicase, partial [Thaumarchaeota archaeon]|nr:RNA helicase [Nitrososphaerota archaeon]
MDIKLVFDKEKIDRELIKTLDEIGITNPTEIQAKAIPYLIEKEDVIAQSNTGTGKTLAFGIPIVQNIKEKTREIEALVVVPTRELSQQVTKDLKEIATYKQLRVTKICGGESPNIQRASLKRGPSIVVATPGRLIDFIERRVINLDWIKFLVIDEADTMLEMGFIDDIEFIIRSIKNKHQTALFSATFPKPIIELTKKYQNQAKRIIINEDNKIAEDKLEQYYLCSSEKNKKELLVELINDIEPKKTIIFCRTKKDSYHIHKLIKNMGVRSVVINGDMSQNQRDRSMNSFKQTRTKIIVATDLLSRGIHVENVDYIINYNVPKNRDSYFHRIGRTARIGNTGKAITIIAGRETREFHELKRKITSLIKNFEGNVTYENQIPLEEAKSNSRNRGEGYGGGRSRSFSRNRGEGYGGTRSSDGGSRSSYGGN